jgi:hypothetical protein
MRRAHFAIALFAAACGATAAPPARTITERSPPAPASESVIGRWTGMGEQTPANADQNRWEIVVEISGFAAGECGHVAYPSLDCSGVWICEPGGNEREIRAREHITKGLARCVDGGDMQITLTDAGELEWTWSGDNTGMPSSARGTLRRAAATD